MELLDLLLGRKNGRDDITDLIGGFSKWIFRCGCLLLVMLVGGIALLLGGVISLGEQGLTVVVVIITMIVAVASLIKTSLER